MYFYYFKKGLFLAEDTTFPRYFNDLQSIRERMLAFRKQKSKNKDVSEY